MSAFDGALLRGKTIMITGASSGIGAHLAGVFASAGASLILTARRQAELEATAENIRAFGADVVTSRLDVTNDADIEGLSDLFSRTDVLVNNAGVVREGLAQDISPADWDAVLDTNLRGMFLMAGGFARAAIKRGAGGSIINVASVLGLRQAGSVLPYAVSKAGAIQMTKLLALEWARYGIRVNAIAPGYLETELNQSFWETEAGKALIRRIPQRRLGRLGDLDGPMLLLASDLSAYMTGAVLAVDGGHLTSSL